MEYFQKMVLIVAIVILIVSLVLIGIALGRAKVPVWPPLVPECPDYWAIDGSGNDAKCVNIKDLGTCPIEGGTKHQTMNFNDPAYADACAKYTWAGKCKIAWDGITYGVQNPCSTQPFITA